MSRLPDNESLETIANYIYEMVQNKYPPRREGDSQTRAIYILLLLALVEIVSGIMAHNEVLVKVGGMKNGECGMTDEQKIDQMFEWMEERNE